jgi:hypothetical protein
LKPNEDCLNECEHDCFCEEESHSGPPNLRLNGKVKISNYTGIYADYKGTSTMFNDYNPDCAGKEYAVAFYIG